MDLTLTENQEMIAETARDLLEARSPIAHVRELVDDARGYSPELWTELSEMGWTGLAIPEDHGGEGAGFVELCLIIEAMGGTLLPGPFVPTVAIAATAITEHGSDTLKKDHLGAIASGERIVSYLRASPGPGWPEHGSSVATDEDDGSHVLSGSAQFASYAEAADVLMVVTQSEDPEDLTVFLIDSESDGLSIEPLDTVGLDHQAVVGFDGVQVGPAEILGEPGSGREVVDTIETYGAAATCAGMVGGAQRVLGMTLEYAGDREQFDTPIGAFQAVQHHCANMGVDVLSSRLMAYEAIWRLGEGLDATREVSMAKAWVSEAYERVCALAHQIHGAIGYTEEHDLHLYLRHATSLALAFGDADHHWARVADHLGIPDRSHRRPM
ncbi:MAG: acyl-CoA dehydrogenase [Acidimicrobiia bacterium]|nr:acyl-CoA dehydrogenase [Acidimicrobiia bacterium]